MTDPADRGRRLRLWLGVPLSLGALAVALVGLLALMRGTPIEGVRQVGGGTPAVTDTTFTAAAELLVPMRLEAGSRVALLADGHGTFPRLLADLRAARRNISFQVYFWRPGALSDSVGAVLREQARRGVVVRLLFDAVGAKGLGDYSDSLRAAGVQVAELRPVSLLQLNRTQQRSHVRAVVIDGVVGHTGGFGIADEWLGGGRAPGQWRETNVRLKGPAVLQLQAAFAAAWAEATGELLLGEPLFPPAAAAAVLEGAPPESGAGTAVAADNRARAGIVHTAPGIGSTPAERLLALSIAGARRTLYVTNAYFVPDDDFRRLLREAVRRGVDVRVLVPGEDTDIPLTRLAGRADYEELLAGGVRIYEYQPSMIHAKTLVADGEWSLVGTMNFDNRSLALNDEVTLVAADAELGRGLEALFLEDLEYSREILLREFRRRGWWARLQEETARLIANLL